jgi:choline dehydrogenase-like flavoprotein
VARANISADAIVIGSGAGGAPAAFALAESGRRVVILEAGPRLETSDFTGDEGEMTARLYKLAAAGRSMSLYAGACVGGSTVINDALCFRPPAQLLEAWRGAYGLRGLSAQAMAPYVDRVWSDIHAEPTGPAHMSRNAAVLARGAQRLDWDAATTPRSVRNCVNLGLCNLGCPSGAKQSTLVTYIPRAERAGARVLADTRAERIRVEAGAVVGVDAVRLDAVTRRPVEHLSIDAPVVCVAAGVLETPALLLRSAIHGVTGAGVAFHTTTYVMARFPEPIHGYYGPTMGFTVTEFATAAGSPGLPGPGVLIENTSVQPLATAPAIPGFGAVHAERMRLLPFIAKALVLVTDHTRGRAAADGSIHYEHVVDDFHRLRLGMRETARAFLAAGASEVWLPLHRFPPVRTEADLVPLWSFPLDDSAFTMLYAVHLFGGATMGRDGPCDETGRCRSVRGLYVTDASCLPSNTGVNPQVTIMANALRIAAGITAGGGGA